MPLILLPQNAEFAYYMLFSVDIRGVCYCHAAGTVHSVQWLDDLGLGSQQERRFISSPKRPDVLCSQPSLLCGTCQGSFLLGTSNADLNNTCNCTSAVPVVRHNDVHRHSSNLS